MTADLAGPPLNRLDRRKQATRAALIRAAQQFLAEDRPSVPILEITTAADVGMGSFYNHFSSREELFGAAIDEALERHGQAIAALTCDVTDPAVAFALRFRLTGRMHRLQPQLSKVIINHGPALTTSDRGLAPLALRDIEAGCSAGRFTVTDPLLALVVVGGALLCLGQLIHDHPERDDAADSDRVTEDLLRMLGVPASEAAAICRLPLPDVGAR